MSAPIHAEGNTADREIVITRVFDAPRELVWEAARPSRRRVICVTHATLLYSFVGERPAA